MYVQAHTVKQRARLLSVSMQYVPILLFASVFVAQTVFDLGAIVFLLLHMSTIKRHLLFEAIVFIEAHVKLHIFIFFRKSMTGVLEAGWLEAGGGTCTQVFG